MAVLVEGISVVIKAEAILHRYPGGWDGFKAGVPNRTLCADGELVRLGFMTPDDTKVFVDHLGEYGIEYLVCGKAKDLVVVDQQRGMAACCDWAEFGRIDWHGDPKKEVAACRAIGSGVRQVLTPDGWTYENSLSSHFRFVESGWVPEFMGFLRHENGLEVYRDLETGKEVYVGRTSAQQPPEPYR